MVEMKVRNNDKIDKMVNIAISADELKIGVFLHIRILHMNTRIEYYRAVLYLYYYAGSAYLLACSQGSYCYVLVLARLGEIHSSKLPTNFYYSII
jgi:hypothetical protein